jgi:hypothetical protein
VSLRCAWSALNISQLACEDYNVAFSRKIVDIQANFWYGRLIMLNPHYAQVELEC